MCQKDKLSITFLLKRQKPVIRVFAWDAKKHQFKPMYEINVCTWTIMMTCNQWPNRLQHSAFQRLSVMLPGLTIQEAEPYDYVWYECPQLPGNLWLWGYFSLLLLPLSFLIASTTSLAYSFTKTSMFPQTFRFRSWYLLIKIHLTGLLPTSLKDKGSLVFGGLKGFV